MIDDGIIKTMILGIPIQWEDKNSSELHFYQIKSIQSNKDIPLSSSALPFDIHFNFDFDFTEDVNTYEKHGFSHFTHRVGGYIAFIAPIWGIVTPLFALAFLV